MPGATEKQFADLEAKLAELNGTTNPEVYRRPYATLGKRKLDPSIYPSSVPLYHGTDNNTVSKDFRVFGLDIDQLSQDQIINVVFEKGLPARGGNIDMHGHVTGAEDIALRGTTDSPALGKESDVGAAKWAGDSGYIIQVDGIHGWNANSLLEGKKDASGKIISNSMGGEQEYSILAQVPS